MSGGDNTRYRLLEEDIEERLRAAKKLLQQHNQEYAGITKQAAEKIAEKNVDENDREEGKETNRATRISFVGEKEYRAEQMRKAKEAYKNEQKEMHSKRKERMRSTEKTIIGRMWIPIVILTIATIAIYARYRYETKGIQIAGYEMYICHTPGCKMVKKIEYKRIVYFNGIHEAVFLGYQPCPICHKTIQKMSMRYSPNDNINDILESDLRDRVNRMD